MADRFKIVLDGERNPAPRLGGAMRRRLLEMTQRLDTTASVGSGLGSEEVAQLAASLREIVKTREPEEPVKLTVKEVLATAYRDLDDLEGLIAEQKLNLAEAINQSQPDPTGRIRRNLGRAATICLQVRNALADASPKGVA